MGFARRGWVLWRSSTGDNPGWLYGEVQVRGDKVYLKPVADEPEPDGEVWITPAFADLHCHLAIDPEKQADLDLIRKNALTEIQAGVLAIRQPGTPIPVPLDALPYHRPIVVDSGKHIALEKRYIRGVADEVPSDNPDDTLGLLVTEVRKQARRGTGWVKLVGDWIDRSEGNRSDLKPLWTRGELIAAVEAAHQEGARVAVHTFSNAAIDDLLAAGVDSIEHGSGMTLQQMGQAMAAGIPVIPTTSQVLKFPEFAAAGQAKYPVYAHTMTAMYKRRHEWFQDLLDSGVQILPGSDAGGYQPHGSVVEEVQRWVKWGMPTSQAFAAATWGARDFLGLDSLSEGAPADFLIFDQDPSANAGVWSAPIGIVANGILI